MSNGDFSFSFDIGSASQSRPVAAPRYIARPFEARPVGDEALLLAAGDESAHRMPLFYAQALAQCDQFRTLDEHTSALMQSLAIPSAQQAAVRQGLDGLVQRDLLRSEERVFELLGGNDAMSQADALDTVCIRTCQRPADLLVLLQGLSRHASDAGIRHALVLDDGPDRAASEATAAAIRRAPTIPGLEIVHIDRPRRTRIVEHLARETGANASALKWLIEGDPEDPEISYGSNLNLALLLTAGRRFLMIDDDAVLDPYQIGDAGTGLSLRVSHSFELSFPQPDQPETEQFIPASVNPLKAHADLLGQNIAGVARLHGLQAGHLLRNISPQMIHEFSLRPRLRLTTNGTLGDSGTGDLLWLYSLPAAMLQSWLEGPESYRRQVLGRRVARATSETQIAASVSLMTTTLTGVDNRELLLPVGAKGSGEDLMFGATIRYLYPGTPCAALPWMLPHRMNSIRRWESEHLFRRRGLGLSRYMADRIEDLIAVQLPAQTGGRSQVLAGWMQALSQSTDEELITDLRRNLLGRRAETAAAIGKTLAELNPPDWLRKDFQTLMDHHRQLGPEDNASLQRVVPRVRAFASAYGSALESWVAAWQHAAANPGWADARNFP